MSPIDPAYYGEFMRASAIYAYFDEFEDDQLDDSRVIQSEAPNGRTRPL